MLTINTTIDVSTPKIPKTITACSLRFANSMELMAIEIAPFINNTSPIIANSNPFIKSFNDFIFFLVKNIGRFTLLTASGALHHRSNCRLTCICGFAEAYSKAKLARKLHKKGAAGDRPPSNFRDKTNVSVEASVRFYLFYQIVFTSYKGIFKSLVSIVRLFSIACAISSLSNGSL